MKFQPIMMTHGSKKILNKSGATTMTIFTVFNFIYWGFFAIILILALNVYFRLRALANQIAHTEEKSSEINPVYYQSTDSFLLHSSPNFPLSALIKILPGTFIGFGILGTFLGFSSGISGMRLTGNVDELFGKLDKFFVGLNSAFITSIIGVVLSVLFGTILYQWPLNKIKFHCARIYNELTKTQTPAEATKSEFDAYIGSLQEMTKTLLAAKDTIEVTMQSAVEKIETLPEKFLEVGKVLEESVAPVKNTFLLMQTTLENYSKQAESLQNASEQIQLSLTKFIETSGQTTEKVNESLEKTISATKEIQENNTKLNDDHRKLLDDYKNLHENLSSIQEKAKEEVASYSEEIKNQFSQLLTKYSEQSRAILQNQNEQLLESQKSTLDEYKEIDEKIGSILETVNKNLGDYSATIEKALVQTLEEYNKTAQKVTESFFGERK